MSVRRVLADQAAAYIQRVEVRLPGGDVSVTAHQRVIQCTDRWLGLDPALETQFSLVSLGHSTRRRISASVTISVMGSIGEALKPSAR
jgi:hypothetical protein